MKGLNAILSGTGLVSGVGGIAALTVLNKAPTSSVLEVVEEKSQVEEKKEGVTVAEPAPVMDVYVVGYKKANDKRQPLVDEISPKKLTDEFIALDTEIKKCSLRGNDQGRSYVYWNPIQRKFACWEKFQWQDWFAVGNVKRSESLGELKLSGEMERASSLRKSMITFDKENP
ncbi:hypothetical protein HF1_01380 [Mycoplasma haemofelis str. Langford 1]|uniref:Uncharacterized protein n=1 Tax=Mycoplasma haemofelis (strain Langford 1) TaxID=941640 RepID=E8ZKI0_MYCHL|nr:hypothetical protein [Mycoplasma haemofelis]CBY92146.1 hypothetical protein HF1_01380 [Mycoplasma haemofelis str. Langford 1]